MSNILNQAPLGKKSAYIDNYTPKLLYPIPRRIKREEIAINDTKLPFIGCDLWTGYELSWLNVKGKPCIAIATFIIPCQSQNLIESKSFKLYLNSYNNSRFDSESEVQRVLTQDLSEACQAPVEVMLHDLDDPMLKNIGTFEGECLDPLDIECNVFTVKPQLLRVESTQQVTESVYSHLLKSNCLVTGQPDWGSLWIQYQGPKINHASLLQYIVSFRNHNEFHEQCVERIFQDIMCYAKPKSLTVYARYTRRGGLDINPYRSTENQSPQMKLRLFRQ